MKEEKVIRYEIAMETAKERYEQAEAKAQAALEADNHIAWLMYSEEASGYQRTMRELEWVFAG